MVVTVVIKAGRGRASLEAFLATLPEGAVKGVNNSHNSHNNK